MDKNIEIYNEVKALYDNKSTANYIIKIVKGINEEFERVFKGTELDVPTIFGNKGNAAEKVYAYLFGIHYCPDCGKKTSYISKTKGYNNRCGTCGPLYAARNIGAKAKAKANWHTETFICKECGKEFEHIVHPNNSNYKTFLFCSHSCRCSYVHKHMSEDQRTDIKERRKKTCKEKYGTEYVVNSQYTRDKTKEKLGVEYPQLLPNYGEICKESYKRNHNGQEFHHSAEVKQKILQTKLKKYGPLLSTIKNKTYTFPSGKQVYIQGYENFAIDKLLETYSEEDIVVERKNIKDAIGKDIIYVDKDNLKHIYFPDIYIKSKNLVIEVKSEYTYNVHKEINLRKRDAVLNEGIDFKFMIIKTYHKQYKSHVLI